MVKSRVVVNCRAALWPVRGACLSGRVERALGGLTRHRPANSLLGREPAHASMQRGGTDLFQDAFKGMVRARSTVCPGRGSFSCAWPRN